MKIIRWTLATLLLAGALSMEAPVAPLEAQECVAVTMDDQPRNCTATEELGQCLFEAVDSYRQCSEIYTQWWIGWVCEAYMLYDSAMCLLSGALPFE